MDSFRNFIEKVISYELSPRAHQSHASLELLLDGLSGDLAPDARSRLAAHLATCPQCLSRWRELKELLKGEQRALETKAELVSLPQLLRDRETAKLTNRVRAWFTPTVSPFRLRPALAFATATLVLVLAVFGVTYPLLKGASGRISSLTKEVASLREEIKYLTQGVGIPSTVATVPSREEVVALLEEAAKVADPWQRSLIIASFLSSHGIEVPPYLDWTRTKPYKVRPGDTWEKIAEEELGDRAMWVILYLLNVKDVPQGELSPGREIRIPERR